MEGRPTVLRLKRGRDEAGLGDFVVREDASLEGRLQCLALEGGAGDRRRVFRLVASLPEKEAADLVAREDFLEETRRTRT